MRDNISYLPRYLINIEGVTLHILPLAQIACIPQSPKKNVATSSAIALDHFKILGSLIGVVSVSAFGLIS